MRGAPEVLRRNSRVVAAVCFALSTSAVIASVVIETVVLESSGAAFVKSAARFMELVFIGVGALTVTKRPENRISWLFLWIGFGLSLTDLSASYADFAYYGRSHPLAFGTASAWLESWIWIPTFGPLFLILLLWFPDGRVPGPRWRYLERFVIVLLSALSGLTAFGRDPEAGADVRNPLATEFATDILGAVFPFLTFGFPVLVLMCAGSLVLRYRRSRGQQRQQLKWFVGAAALVPLYMLVDTVGVQVLGISEDSPLLLVLGAAAFTSLPVSAAVAILKYRLYDIDVVINKAVVYGGLAAFITAVYVAIVVGIGTALGQGEEPNLALSIAATAVVAVAFQPVRDRVHHVANRLVYGERATPYEVLSEFSKKVGETYAANEVLPRMARTISEGTGAARAEVWLKTGNELRRAATFPEEEGAGTLKMGDASLPAIGVADATVGVQHQGELLGAFTVTKKPGEVLTPAEESLLHDLAGQAGLVLRNVGLTSELLARLDELQASRQRLVAAQDEERRRLERNLHDGAQQHLVALKMKLGLAERLAKDEDDKLQRAIAQLKADADEALETLRDLARGIYPPMLADQGLKAALESQARKASVPVTVEAERLSRYPQEVEAAVYFCVLEALQNVAKYAGAKQAWVSVQERDAELVFEVRDDGVGFDLATTPKGAGTTNMSDRLESLGGSLELRSRPGEGTTVTGTLPLREREFQAVAASQASSS